MLLFEIRVEKHGKITNEDSAEPGGAHFFIVQQDQTIFARALKLTQLSRKMPIEVDAKFTGNFIFENQRVAEQPIDDRAAQTVLAGEAIATHGSDAAVLHGFLPTWQVTMVLRVGILKRANGRDAHAVEISSGFCGIALKVSVQGSLLLRNRQLIAGLGEMVHADVEIACFDKLHQAGTKYLKFLHAFRQVSSERALLLFEPGRMSITK